MKTASSAPADSRHAHFVPAPADSDDEMISPPQKRSGTKTPVRGVATTPPSRVLLRVRAARVPRAARRPPRAPQEVTEDESATDTPARARQHARETKRATVHASRAAKMTPLAAEEIEAALGEEDDA